MTPNAPDAGAVPGPGNTTRSAPTGLIVTREHWRQIVDHLRASLPAEGCGLLAGADGDDGEVTISHLFPGTNTLQSPTRYRMDPAEVIAAFRTMREQGLRLAAIFHSHPASPPSLSPIDIAEAHYPEAAYIVVSFATGEPTAVAWRIERRGSEMTPAEIPIHVQTT